MPCKAWLTGDSEPFWLSDPADVVIDALERAAPGAFIRLDMVPPAAGEAPRASYVRADRVSAVGWLDPRELAYAYENLPSWLAGDD